MGLKTVNIRELKDKLSAYLRAVQHGDVLLVTDRGKVVAEVRQPSTTQAAPKSPQEREQVLVDRGDLVPGLPNKRGAYGSTGVTLADEDIDASLAWTRGEL